MLRSPHAHALLRSIDAGRALADPRVLAVLAGADVANLPPLECIDAEETTRPFNQPILAQGKVRYVGEPVAVLVAEDRYVAEDALGLVEVDYEPLPAVARRGGPRGGRPVLHDETNLVELLEYATGDATAIERAPHRLRASLPDAAACGHASRDPRLRRRMGPGRKRDHAAPRRRSRTPSSGCRALPRPSRVRVRVVAPDVGGAFGTKLQIYPEEILVSCSPAGSEGR